jgi:hypothetical protein
MSEEIVNRVAQSGIVTFDLEDLYIQGERVTIDLKENLYMGMVLREKDFRDFVKTEEWEKYRDKFVSVTCTEDAIIPTWAYMLVASRLAGIARKTVFGGPEALETALFQERLSSINSEDFRDKKVVVKGCSKFPVPVSAYVLITEKFTPVVSSLMFGEPCSTVPVYKKSKSQG